MHDAWELRSGLGEPTVYDHDWFIICYNKQFNHFHQL